MFPNQYDYNNIRGFENHLIRNRLKVQGQGIVKVKPDTAEIVIGVITENKELETAQKENAKITQQVLDTLKAMGIASKDIQTENYTINAEYNYVDGKQVFRGYKVSNYLKITIRNIESVGAVIDSAVNAGANAVNSINFVVSDPSKYYAEALRLAIKNAQEKAMVVASKLKTNINLIPVQIVERVGSTAAPLTATYKAAAATPIEAGENSIIANIEAIFIYNE